MVENMSFFVCAHCGERQDISGAGGAKLRAAELNVPFLGEIPLFKDLRVLADEGRLAEAADHPGGEALHSGNSVTPWSPDWRKEPPPPAAAYLPLIG